MNPPVQAQNQTESSVRVSISEAARLFGINPRTIRRAIKDQHLRYIVVQNRYKISFASLVTWSQSTGALKRKRDEHGIGQWVDQWKIKNTRFSPRPPAEKTTDKKEI
jgi:excisionase family DNA binding protein